MLLHMQDQRRRTELITLHQLDSSFDGERMASKQSSHFLCILYNGTEALARQVV